jgi:hypothetical protein
MHLKLRPCINSFQDLIEHASPTYLRHAYDNGKYTIDLLQIDVEGADYEVLELIDWDVIKPQCINYESFHLKERQVLAAELLRSQNYTLVQVGKQDTLACLVH